MVGRDTWRKSAAFVLAIGLSAGLIFFLAGSRAKAGAGLLEHLRTGVQTGVRFLSGEATSGGAPTAGPSISGKSARLYALEQKKLSEDKHLLRWGGIDFDPLSDDSVPKDMLPELLGSRETAPDSFAGTAYENVEYWIFQYTGPARELRSEIRASGAVIVGFVPNSAYLVRVSGAQLAKIQASTHVRWSGRQVPAYKVDTALRAMIAAGDDTTALILDLKGMVRINLTLYQDVPTADYQPLIEKIPGVEILNTQLETTGGYGEVLVAVNPADLKNAVVEMAALRDVANVDSSPMPHVENDQSVWFMQSGWDAVGASNYDQSATLFAHDICGRGMLGGVTDSGVENDLCFYRYGAAIKEAGWVVGPSANSITTPVPCEGGDLPDPPAIPPIRTRARKIVAYYVQQGAAAYSDSTQHGTSTTGCMAGDNFQVLAARPLIRNVGECQNVRPYTPTGDWTVGEVLRNDLIPKIDDVSISEPAFPTTYGQKVQHHQARDGMAPGAMIVFQDIGDAGGNLSGVSTTLQMFMQTSGTGSTTTNASYGTAACTGCYSGGAPSDADRALWMRRDLVSFVAAGNDGATGAQTISGGIAQAKDAITVGASERGDSVSCDGTPCSPSTTRRGNDMANFSSRGPKTAGMMAPEVVAPGIVVTPASEGLAVQPEDGTGSGDGGCGTPTNNAIDGTSFSSPTMAGIGLLVEQYFYDGFYPSGVATPINAMRPSNALVRAVLVNSARNMLGGRTDDTGTGQGNRPNFGQGWGSPRVDDTLYFPGDPQRHTDPAFDTQRSRFAVLNDTFNGFDGTYPLTAEPGGQTRDNLVNNFKPAITDGGVHEFFVNVINDTNGDTIPDLNDAANELRVTMAYMDQRGASATAPSVNDLDLEVVSPGPDGILQTVADTLLGDDVVYRPDPLTGWLGGFSIPAVIPRIQHRTAGNFDTTLDHRDSLNTVENVFVKPQDIVAGTWRIRVVGYSVPGGDSTSNGRPNIALGDRPPVFDTNGDTINDTDFEDTIFADNQGYALILSGNFTTTQGLLSLNKSQFGCSGESLSVTLNDSNGDAAPQAPCTGLLQAVITTTSPNIAFPTDLETVDFTGAQPTYRSRNPVTGLDNYAIQIVTDPAQVIHGDGIIEIVAGETIVCTYQDSNPCGGRSFAQAIVGCSPSVGDSGFQIQDGCDYTITGDPTSGVTPDGFLDDGELARYTVFFFNNGGTDLHDCRVTLTPDPTDPYASFVTVSPAVVNIGLAPPGRRSDATFFVQLAPEPAIPPQHQMSFIVGVTSPIDGLLYPDTFAQTQILESDVEAHRYDTRDPNGELFGQGRIEVTKDGSTPGPTTPPSLYVTNDPMWYDPDGAGAAACNVSRDRWPGPATPPPGCDPTIYTGNSFNPWDFDDTDEGFVEYPFDGDAIVVGRDTPLMFNWKAAPTGGGCGWEDQLNDQLVTNGNPLPPGHPDRIAQPWGIWHTGAINPVTPGPFAGDTTNNQGAPYYVNAALGDRDPNDHTIIWDSSATTPPPPGANNSTGQWCSSYYSNPNLGQYYRSILLPPRMHRVHRLNPEFKVEFQQLKFQTRMDGHTIDGNNLVAASWLVHNQPVDPASTTGRTTYSWAQFQYRTHIFTDHVAEKWTTKDNDITVNLRHPNDTFPDLTYEDVYGPAATDWNFAFGWSHLHFDARRSHGQYGWGFDDVSFVWTETREVPDTSICSALPAGQPATITFDEQRYNACEGNLGITLIAPNETRSPLAVCVTSSAEHYEKAILTRGANGRWTGVMPFTTDPRNDAAGILLASAGSADTGQGADTARVIYDPGDNDPNQPADLLCDWRDSDSNGINDDFNTNTTGAPPPDGIPDAEDDPTGTIERADTTVINCTSGRLFYIKHVLQQVGAGDNDRFADHGERMKMGLYLVSSVGADLSDVDIRISTTDPICLINDTVHMDTLPGDSSVVATPVEFEFAVPTAYTSTVPGNIRTITFRIDVTGTNTQNLNQFSTAGDSFNTFLPMEAVLLADVDEVQTAADYNDNRGATRTGRVPGEFLEAFEGSPSGTAGLDHPLVAASQPGCIVVAQDATTDTRWKVNLNGGFCPECDFLTDCAVPSKCPFQFTPTGPNADPHGTTEFALTQAWAHRGVGSYKWGDPTANAGVTNQHYSPGQYVSLQLPPLRISNDPAVTPTLHFWHIANIWRPFFTSGLNTPIDGAVIEISASPVGVGDSGVAGNADNARRANPAAILATYPLSSFRRLSPDLGVYEDETDALNSCRTLFCRYKHPVFAQVGSPTTPPASPADPTAGSVGPATWGEVNIDLSDYRGMEVVIQFSAEVLEELNIQAGSMGWFIDDLDLNGISNRVAIRQQAANITTDPCLMVADFAATDPACFGNDVQFFDRHAGTGTFDVSSGQPYPLEFEWIIGSLDLRGMSGATVAPTPGVFGTYDNPRINFQAAAGIASASSVPVTLKLYQNGVLVSQITKNVIYKDAPVPAFTYLPNPSLAGATTRFAGTATFNAALDATRSLVWEWDFGDGTPIDSSGPNVQHVFAAIGNYTVTARVFDEDGCTSSTSQVVPIGSSPLFTAPTMTFANDCPPGPTHDGNADINEYVTVNLTFTNSGPVTATGVVGYLTSPDINVEITGGVASFGNVAPAATPPGQPFQFIRRDDGTGAPPCLVVPFTLTLVSNGGSVLQRLDISYTMGQSSNVAFCPAAPPFQSFCLLDATDPTSGFTEFSFSPPGGCLDGLELSLRLTATGSALTSNVQVEILTPDFRSVQVLASNDAPNNHGPFDLHFLFGANNGTGCIPDTGGVVNDVFNTLPDTIQAGLIPQVAGTAMVGAQPWKVRVSTSVAGNCGSGTFGVTLNAFNLEGTNSADLEVATEPACATCVTNAGSTPVFDGDRTSCTGPRVVFSPALDTSVCGGIPDVTYQLYASTVAGQLGQRIDGPTGGGREMTPLNCALFPDGMAAETRLAGATTWKVCDLANVYWTVIAVDSGGQRMPNISTPTDAVPPGYQTSLVVCSPPSRLLRNNDVSCRASAFATDRSAGILVSPPVNCTAISVAHAQTTAIPVPLTGSHVFVGDAAAGIEACPQPAAPTNGNVLIYYDLEGICTGTLRVQKVVGTPTDVVVSW